MEIALKNLEPHGIANYLQELATQFHKFYGKCRVITENKRLSQARLGLVSSVRIVLSSGLSILGITAPEKM
jgi:arginyl-tRNA synthetase